MRSCELLTLFLNAVHIYSTVLCCKLLYRSYHREADYCLNTGSTLVAVKARSWAAHSRLTRVMALTRVVPSSQYLETDVLPQVTWRACNVAHLND